MFEWLFGFESMELLAFPMTALGAVGAALGLLPTFNAAGILAGNAIAVFTAIGMCWSGFLSTHTAMLDSWATAKPSPRPWAPTPSPASAPASSPTSFTSSSPSSKPLPAQFFSAPRGT